MSSFRLAVALAVPVALAGCSRAGTTPGAAAPASDASTPAAPQASAPAAAPAAAAAPDLGNPKSIVAEVNGAAILASDLERRAAGRLTRLRQEEYELRSQVLDDMIAERLVAAEAKKQGLTAEELLRREVDARIPPLDPTRVETIYQQNKLRFAGATHDEAVARIREVLSEQLVNERRTKFEKELRGQAQVAVRLQAPRTEVAIPAGAPSTGPSRAPVTIVEFTDYQCPYCHRAQSVIEEVLQRYSGKVRLVHLDFPLEGHPEALPAARAARCAGEQGKFWEYHRGLMSQPGSLDAADLKSRAAALRLREGAFASCLASDRHDKAIQAELHQGAELGVTGTPAYFVNGRLLSGARPIEAFTEVIDAELAPRS